MDDIKELLWKYAAKAAEMQRAKQEAMADSRPDDMYKAEGALLAYKSVVKDLRGLGANGGDSLTTNHIMSHITTVKVQITDLDALAAACRELGAVFAAGQQTYCWYGAKPGKCDHAIKVPGVNYEIGVIHQPDGFYALVCDFYGNDGHDGWKLRQRFGDGCKKLVQIYTVQKASQAAHAKGYMVQRQAGAKGTIKLIITK